MESSIVKQSLIARAVNTLARLLRLAPSVQERIAALEPKTLAEAQQELNVRRSHMLAGMGLTPGIAAPGTYQRTKPEPVPGTFEWFRREEQLGRPNADLDWDAARERQARMKAAGLPQMTEAKDMEPAPRVGLVERMDGNLVDIATGKIVPTTQAHAGMDDMGDFALAGFQHLERANMHLNDRFADLCNSTIPASLTYPRGSMGEPIECSDGVCIECGKYCGDGVCECTDVHPAEVLERIRAAERSARADLRGNTITNRGVWCDKHNRDRAECDCLPFTSSPAPAYELPMQPMPAFYTGTFHDIRTQAEKDLEELRNIEDELELERINLGRVRLEPLGTMPWDHSSTEAS
jgi:hypothetical protein